MVIRGKQKKYFDMAQNMEATDPGILKWSGQQSGFSQTYKISNRVERARTFDWLQNSFIMVVYENLFLKFSQNFLFKAQINKTFLINNRYTTIFESVRSACSSHKVHQRLYYDHRWGLNLGPLISIRVMNNVDRFRNKLSRDLHAHSGTNNGDLFIGGFKEGWGLWWCTPPRFTLFSFSCSFCQNFANKWDDSTYQQNQKDLRFSKSV